MAAEVFHHCQCTEIERPMANDIHRTVREVCLWLPEAEEFSSHGSPNFRVRGKTFATYVINHHGDQRVALWLPAAEGAQEHLVGLDPKSFYVPPYVGPRGWVGVRLDQRLSWKRIAALVREAYERVAPAALRSQIGPTPLIQAPRRLPASAIDPLKSAHAKSVLAVLRKICLRFPESREVVQFGSPAWQAGTRTFALVRYDGQRLTTCFWVGTERQNLLTADLRYRIPPYIGHNGWIALDASEHCDAKEVSALALQSYRHFALKRMLRELDVG
jgi:predicted DNA-binding protein (MmcQ/YjbR family)